MLRIAMKIFADGIVNKKWSNDSGFYFKFYSQNKLIL
jgi:hypothetical protein